MWSRIRSLAAVFSFALSFAGNSQAAVIINIQQVGPNVVMSTNGGTLNLTTFVSYANVTDSGLIAPNAIALGQGAVEAFRGDFDSYTFSASTPGSQESFADSNTGPLFGFVSSTDPGEDIIAVPTGSVTNDIATINAASSTFSNQSYATLGLSPGEYFSFWGQGSGNQDFFGVIVLPSSNPVPEPSSAAIGLLLAGSAGLVRKYRRQRSQS
jgi:hypothetical protein